MSIMIDYVMRGSQLTVFQLGLSSIDQKHIHDAVRHYDFRGPA